MINPTRCYHSAGLGLPHDSTTVANAAANACSNRCRSLLYGSWDYEEFRRLHLKEYMVMCEGFGAEFTSKDM